MPTEIPCSQCGAVLAVPPNAEGKHLRCPACGGLTRVPVSLGGLQGYAPLSKPSAPAPAPSPPAAPPPPVDPAAAQLWSALGDAFTAKPPSAPYQPAPASPFTDPAAAGQPAWPNAAAFTASAAANAYAPPAEAGLPPAAYLFGPGERAGFPWEAEQSFRSWWETVRLIIFDSDDSFRRLAPEGGFFAPLIFGMINVAIATIVNVAVRIPFDLLEQNAALVITMELVAIPVLTLIVPLLLWPLKAIFIHLFLLMIGGARHGMETTVRAIAYSSGGAILVQAVPCLGPAIGWIFEIYANIMAVMHTHDTSGGKAAFAVIAPTVLWIVLVIGLVVGIVVLAIALS